MGWLLAAETALSTLRGHFGGASWVSLDVYLLWSFLQAGWLSRVDQRSTTIYWYLADLLLGYVAASKMLEEKSPAMVVVLGLAVAAVAITGLFYLSRDMRRYFKSTDDLDLYMSGWMIWFFNTLYFQYKFGEVSRLRRAENWSISSEGR